MATDPRWNRRHIAVSCAIVLCLLLVLGFFADLFNGLELTHGHQSWLMYLGSLVLMGVAEALSEGIGELLFHPRVFPWILLGGVIAAVIALASSMARLKLR